MLMHKKMTKNLCSAAILRAMHRAEIARLYNIPRIKSFHHSRTQAKTTRPFFCAGGID
jgi:hypothetical protein